MVGIDRSRHRVRRVPSAPSPFSRGGSSARTAPEDPALSVRTFHASGAISFSTKGEYGVRMLVQLARRWAGEATVPVSLAEVATEEDLPRAYLEQLVIPLREADLVQSTRGARGGYALARPPAEITLAEALRALEGPLAPMVCASEDPAHADACVRLGACSVNVLWIRVRDAISGVLDGTTLADLIPAPHLIELKGRTAAGPAADAALDPAPVVATDPGLDAAHGLDREPVTV
jgi:Rrf2 family transcriptional regulator, cysteine metabolism repressor